MPRLSRPFPPLRLAWLLSGVAACADGGGTAGAGGSGGSGLGQGGVDALLLPYEPCADAVAVGQFVIALGEGYTSVDGKVSDAVLPSQVPDELAREGDCRLLEAAQATCEPACPVATQVCSREGACVALPRARDVGTVTVHGLVISMQMRPNAVTRSYVNPAQPMLPNPGFLPGADLRISTDGGDYAPFELRGWGISPLLLDLAPIQVLRGQATAFTWSAPAVAGPARVNAVLNINQHGSNKAWIECDFADTGAAEIPAPLVDALFGQGLSGFPTLTATRRSATSRDIEPGCVDLLVASEVARSVEVQGITSCEATAECPAGTTCLPVERFCQ